ncbi:MAG: bifunctional 2-C-methyl-D-erythritol 4-phosphate cytidylyltransferase/2-C-methyl-D-erythritol 2,4-cyclodiphosphate synthase [Novosphingobium sp.]
MSELLYCAGAAIVVAAGKGLRSGQKMPKQFALWRGKPLLRHSVERFAELHFAPIVVAIPQGAEILAAQALAGIDHVEFVTGGATRQESVRNALETLADRETHRVLIHDAARPVIPDQVFSRLADALCENDGAIPVLPVIDSLTRAERGKGQFDVMGEPAQREALRRVQTPQEFWFEKILAAHRAWQGPLDAGDDAQVARTAGLSVALVEGDEALKKLTTPEDFAALPAMRIGTGYDVHRLVEGEELWLCGLQIDHTHGLSGHSDADVAIHALVDALLGAISSGDIGQHFPPGDPQWKGARSAQFLAHAARLVAQSGYEIGNVDLTIICEAPKIGPHRQAMRESLADMLGIDFTAVSVKATTTEGLDSTGRREGIAAQAVASLVRT